MPWLVLNPEQYLKPVVVSCLLNFSIDTHYRMLQKIPSAMQSFISGVSWLKTERSYNLRSQLDQNMTLVPKVKP